MRGTPFTKNYPGPLQTLWDRFDRLPLEYRTMVADDPDGNLDSTLDAAEELAREAGLLPPLEKEDNTQTRSEKDRARTEAAKKRSRIVYYVPAGTPSRKYPPVEEVVKVAKQRLQSKSEHNS